MFSGPCSNVPIVFCDQLPSNTASQSCVRPRGCPHVGQVISTPLPLAQCGVEALKSRPWPVVIASLISYCEYSYHLPSARVHALSSCLDRLDREENIAGI